jgi:uncharacterized membrane protein
MASVKCCALQVAAVDKPKLHLWETGVMRITRHPQSFGQALWCLAHTLWIGSSFMVATTGKHPSCGTNARWKSNASVASWNDSGSLQGVGAAQKSSAVL